MNNQPPQEDELRLPSIMFSLTRLDDDLYEISPERTVIQASAEDANNILDFFRNPNRFIKSHTQKAILDELILIRDFEDYSEHSIDLRIAQLNKELGVLDE